MPNHVTNRLIIQGTENQIEEIRNFLKGEPLENDFECLIDFNKIVRCPEVINAVGQIHIGIECAVKNKYHISTSKSPLIRELELLARAKNKLRPHDIPAFELACKAYEETGFIYWYDWNYANWGTKWNAYNFDYTTPLHIIIWHTAWSHVIDLMKKLSLKFPCIEFLYDWADEDTSYNCGRSKIKNGEAWINIPKEGSNEAYEIALELRPQNKAWFKLINGKYEYVEEHEG